MILTFNLGTTGKAATTGYQFYDASGASLGARSTSGVTEFGTFGLYFVSLTPPSGAKTVVWDDTNTGGNGVDDVYPLVDTVQLLGTAWLTPGTAGTPDVNTINAVALAGTQTFDNTGTWWGDVQGNLEGYVGGNVQGNVQGNVVGSVGATLGAVTVGELNPDALADVRTALGMASADLDTQLDAILAGGGGGLTAAQTRAALGMAAANLDTQLATITAKTNLITSGNVTIVSPVNDDGSSIAIYRGDDYLEADDRHLQFVVDNVPSLVGATVLLKIKGKEPITGTVVDATNMWFEMARVFTEELTGTDTFPFEIEVELASGSYCTPFVGVLTASGQL